MVLFKAESLNKNADEMCAILTPSTKGLRQSLKDINFTMPLAPQSQLLKKSESLNDFKNSENTSYTPDTNTESIQNNVNFTNTSGNGGDSLGTEDDDEKSQQQQPIASIEDKDDEDDDENDDDDDCEEPDEWLEQIGLNSAVNFKASVLQRNTKNQQKDSLYNFDNRPRSTLVFDQSSDVQALFNFLLNSKSCVNSSGPLSGVPPTLLAPISFVGATLQKNRVEQKVIKSLNKLGDPVTQYAIDLSGPIMPFHVHRLCNLFSVTQSGEFEMMANVYDQSQALNCVKKFNDDSSFQKVLFNVSSSGDSESNSNNSVDANMPKKKIMILNSYLDLSELRSLENEYGLYGESAFVKTVCFKDQNFCCNC
jgi:hypothetical protein